MADNGEATKVKFDARKGFYEELMHCLRLVHEAAAAGDLNSWRVCLYSMFNCVVPWISQEDKERIEQRLRESRNQIIGLYDLPNDGPGLAMIKHKAVAVELSLLEIDQEIKLAGKHLFLPEKEADEETIDMKGLLEGSI